MLSSYANGHRLPRHGPLQEPFVVGSQDAIGLDSCVCPRGWVEAKVVSICFSGEPLAAPRTLLASTNQRRSSTHVHDTGATSFFRQGSCWPM